MSPLNAKTLAIFAATAVVVSALPTMPSPGQCVVDLTSSPYPQMALRPTACNTELPLVMLNDGTALTILDNGKQYPGCGYTYTKVQYADLATGITIDGYVGSKYMDCNSSPVFEQSCGFWSVQHGGPTNACGSGKAYLAPDSAMCNADGSNCVEQCCNIVFLSGRRAA